MGGPPYEPREALQRDAHLSNLLVPLIIPPKNLCWFLTTWLVNYAFSFSFNSYLNYEFGPPSLTLVRVTVVISWFAFACHLTCIFYLFFVIYIHLLVWVTATKDPSILIEILLETVSCQNTCKISQQSRTGSSKIHQLPKHWSQ